MVQLVRLHGVSLLLLLVATRITCAEDGPLPPDEAARQMTVPDGFHVTLFAGEPDVVQPIALAFDGRGRLWVVECLSYPDWNAEGPGTDRVTIYTDADGDGRFDERKVFWDQGKSLSGIEIGFGGVWLCSTPNLIFLPDRNRDDVPDGPPETVLDGWDLKAKHNAFNGLVWGPDGWLYGCNGILSNSQVGKPGAAAEQRVSLNCGVWRYHPLKQKFEAVAHGTTNPWGLDFDDRGAMFFTNCVIKHLFHAIPGAHYVRMFGQDINPYSFGLIESCADHIHWAGGYWDTEGIDKPVNDAFGGGHAHCGAMIYLGDNWPDRYRDTLFTCNIHGRRLNNDRLVRQGSGYVAKHEADTVRSADPWFRGVAVRYGPDGGVYVADWSDAGECHDYDDIHRENGRIFKITYGDVAPVSNDVAAKVDVAASSDAELVQLQLHKNEWHVRQARVELQERAAAGKLSPDARGALRDMLEKHTDGSRRLRALWTLHATGSLDEQLLLKLLADSDEYIRGWTVQLVTENGEPSPLLMERLDEMAEGDGSPLVRLYLASALQRLPVNRRGGLALGLVRHADDADDANLPLLLWYGIEPLVAADAIQTGDAKRARVLLSTCALPLVRNYIARRLALAGNVDAVVRALATLNDPAVHRDILHGLQDALHGRRQAPLPPGWNDVSQQLARSGDAEVRERSLALSVVFGDPRAEAALRAVAADSKAPIQRRTNALSVLVQQKPADLAPLLQKLLADRDLRGAAIRGLAGYLKATTPERLLRLYPSLNDEEKADCISTLSSRPAYALPLLAAIGKNQIPRNDLSPFAARQLLALNDQQVSERLEMAWGTLRPASESKGPLLTKFKELLTPAYLQGADLPHGRQLFTRHCATCHTLFAEGGKIGPELTGAQRANLDYVLENLADPSAVVPRDYQVTLLQTTDGRLVTGIVREENDLSVTMQTATDAVVLPKDEIENRQQTPLSMMPEGLLPSLKDEEVRDLVAYLAAPTQ